MAGRIALDLKSFKHVKSDDKSTTLRHKDGHELTIAHHALSPDMREQLGALAKIPSQYKTQADSEEQRADASKMAKGGDVDCDKPHYGGGGDVAKNLGVKLAPYDQPPVDKATQDTAAKVAAATQQAQQITGQKINQLPPGAMGMGNAAYTMPVAPNQQPQGYIPEGNNPTAMSAMQRGAQTYDKGGKIQKYAEGSVDIPPALDPNAPDDSSNPAFMPHQLPAPENMKIPEDMFGHGASDSWDDKEQNKAPAAPSANEIDKQVAEQVAAEDQPSPEQDQQTMPQSDMEQLAHEAGVANVGPQPSQNDMLGQMEQAQKLGQESVLRSSEAQQDLANEQADANARNAASQQNIADALKKANDEYENGYNQRQKDISDNFINPEQFWTGDPKTGAGSHSKVLSAIGMIIGGFQPMGAPNAAVNYLKYQMDQNLEAQKQNLSTRGNILSHFIEQYRSYKDGLLGASMMYNEQARNELAAAASRAQTPMAQAAALKAQQDLLNQYIPMRNQLMMSQAAMNLFNDPKSNPDAVNTVLNYYDRFDPEKAKALRARVVPGVGTAQIDVPDNTRQQMISMQKLDTAGRDLLQYSKTHLNLNPLSPEYNYGVTKALTFQQMVREGLLGTVFRESEKPLLEKFVNENPAGAFKMIGTEPRLKAILDANGNALNVTKQAYGIRSAAASPQTQPQATQHQSREAALAWANKHPDDPMARSIIKRLSGGQ